MNKRILAAAIAALLLCGLFAFFSTRPSPTPEPPKAAAPAKATPAKAAPITVEIPRPKQVVESPKAPEPEAPPTPAPELTQEDADRVALSLQDAMTQAHEAVLACHEPVPPISWDDVEVGPDDDPDEMRINFLMSAVVLHVDGAGLNRVEWVGEDQAITDSEAACLGDALWAQAWPGVPAETTLDMDLPARQIMIAPQKWIDENPGAKARVKYDIDPEVPPL